LFLSEGGWLVKGFAVRAVVGLRSQRGVLAYSLADHEHSQTKNRLLVSHQAGKNERLREHSQRKHKEGRAALPVALATTEKGLATPQLFSWQSKHSAGRGPVGARVSPWLAQ